MGEMSDYHSFDYNDMAEREEEPTWTTRDKRVIRMKDMDAEHLDNTIRFLEARGARTPREAETDLVAATEMKMTGMQSLQKKYMQLRKEKERRAQMPATHRSAKPRR